ncbi:MAG: ATP-grasp domain-containing protein [Propylenella sp.]
MAEVLLVGLSARALSQSARAAGYAPLAADLFCDLDTREASEACIRIESDLERGIEWKPLITALEALTAGRKPIGMAYCSGFEDRPEFLDRLQERWPLLGNRGDVVARMKDPARLAELCDAGGVPHPRWSNVRQGERWISKRVGGAGGSHVAFREGRSEGRYWQERVHGSPVSALVLGASDHAMVLGFSDQWSDPLPSAPYRYGGAVRPAALSAEVETRLAHAAVAIAVSGGLRGLNSVDFLVGAHGWHLVDVNPRSGTTLDIFRPAAKSLFSLHVDACVGTLPAEPPKFDGAAAAARIVYARQSVTSVPALDWPDWTADRQPPGTAIRAGDPVCTVLAKVENPAEARRLVAARGDEIMARLGAD